MKSIGKKQGQSSRKKYVIIVVIILLLLASGSLAYAYKTHIWPFPKSSSDTAQGVNYSPPTKEQSTAEGSTKQSSSASETTGSDPSPDPTPSASSGQKPSVNMTITSTNEAGGTLSIRTLIETISSSGSCTLAMTGPNNGVYNATSGSQAGPSTSTCEGFAIPVGSLASGKWRIVISYLDSSVQASATKDITIQ